MLGHWTQDHPTKVVVDRGPKGIAATLYKKNPANQHWETINYSSRALTPTEQRYAAIEGESLAILYGITINRMYLYGLTFTVVTDYQPTTILHALAQLE